mgnify:FL=1
MNIKWQILTRVGAILVSCLLIVSMVVTIIFIKQGEENVLEEQNTQVLQAAQQIDSMINEIQVFANNMIIDLVCSGRCLVLLESRCPREKLFIWRSNS